MELIEIRCASKSRENLSLQYVSLRNYILGGCDGLVGGSHFGIVMFGAKEY